MKDNLPNRTLADPAPSKSRTRRSDHAPPARAPHENQPPCACGGACPRCRDKSPLPAKPTMSRPGDPYEREADRLADEVMRDTTATPHMIGRSAPAVDTGAGAPLDDDTRAWMEPRFKQDFSDVRIHADANAAARAAALNARAFTVGRDIAFAPGNYRPESDAGKRLLAHELAHTLQPAVASGAVLARDDDEEAKERKAKAKKDPVVVIRLYPASGSTQFETASGEIYQGALLFNDLAPGFYRATPNYATQHWIIKDSDPGMHFDVLLEDAVPWELAYPKWLQVQVVGSGAPEASESEAMALLDKLVREQVAAIETGLSNIPERSITVGYVKHVRASVLPKVTAIVDEAKGFADAAAKATTDEERKANNQKAGARYQAALIIAQTLQLEVNLVLICTYADIKGTPSGVIKANLEAFDAKFLPLVEAALTFDTSKMASAVTDSAKAYEETVELMNKAITDIDKNAELSRKVIAVADILMIALSIYQVWRIPTVAGGGGVGGSGGGGFNIGRVYGGGTAAATIDRLALEEAIEAIRKLIKIGALDPAVAGTLAALGGSTSSPLPELGKTDPMHMEGTGGGADDLVPGKSPMKEFDMDHYGTFSNRPGDRLAGHEMLQNLWLEVKGIIKARGVGAASRRNPAIALSKELHDAVNAEQRALGLWNRKKLETMSAAENIELNAQAMTNAGVPDFVVKTLKAEALAHAAALGH